MANSLDIIAIEDSEADVQLALRAIRRAGWNAQCRRVETIGDIAATLPEDHWQLVLMDCKVPGLDFDEALAQVLEARPLLPVVIVTGSVGEERAIDLLRAGAWDLVLKDRLDRLAPAIERCLREARERAARAKAEAELRLNETRLTLAVAAAKMGVWEWDLSARRYYWSPECSAITGHDLSEIGPNQFIALIHQDDRPKMRTAISRMLENQGHFGLEFRMTTDRAEQRWINMYGSSAFYEAGMPSQFTGVMQDVSARKRSEHMVRQATALFEGTHEGVLVTDRDGTILSANPAFSTLMDYDARELVGQSTRLFRSNQHDAEFFRAIFAAVDRDGTWEGEIWNRRKSGEILALRCTITAIRDQSGQISGHVATYSDLSQIKASQSQLDFLAHHDPLTRLPNRVLLLSRLQSAIALAESEQRSGAALFLGLDHFKEIDDGYGREIGDEVLRTVADRCRLCLREDDVLARVGGDEFIVLLENLPSPETAGRVAQDLIANIANSILLKDGRELFVDSSIGISVFPADGQGADMIVRRADSARTMAKRQQRGYCYSREHLLSDAASRVDLRSALRRAIGRSEFVLYYQPLVETATRRMIGVEALLRWVPRQGELVAPDSFIPIAEEAGLIVPIGAWVLEAACSQFKEWLDQGATLGILAVNLSPVQFKHPDLLPMVQQCLSRTGLAPHHVELEITESALMDGDESAFKLRALKELGVRLSIDDFGTGYSSLTYLTRFPIDKLKIDHSFVKSLPHDRIAMEIVTAVVSLARSLRLEILAEGVETEEQLQVLRSLDCTFAQGYLFSRPLEPAKLAERL